MAWRKSPTEGNRRAWFAEGQAMFARIGTEDGWLEITTKGAVDRRTAAQKAAEAKKLEGFSRRAGDWGRVCALGSPGLAAAGDVFLRVVARRAINRAAGSLLHRQRGMAAHRHDPAVICQTLTYDQTHLPRDHPRQRRHPRRCQSVPFPQSFHDYEHRHLTRHRPSAR